MAREGDTFRVEISQAASDRLYDHVLFLAKVNVDAAMALRDTLLKDIRSLESFTYRHPVYEGPYVAPGKYLYMLSAGRYRILYQVEGDTVFVDDIQDCRQNQAFEG